MRSDMLRIIQENGGRRGEFASAELRRGALGRLHSSSTSAERDRGAHRVPQRTTRQRRTALRASVTCFAVLTVFGLAGGVLFTFFGITLPAFKMTGGVLLFGVGLEMLRARRSATRSTQQEAREAETKEDVAVVPLGLPLLSGPGSIATVIVLVGKAPGLEHRASVVVAVGAVSAATFLTLRWFCNIEPKICQYG